MLKGLNARNSRNFALAIAVGVLFASAVTASAAPLCGDYNSDKSITAPDALGALRTSVELAECLRAVCDFSGDNRITSADALAILKTAVGTGPEPRCPAAGCNGPDCDPTCPLDALDCCDETTCSGQGTCTVKEDVAVCDCDEGWVGASCNAREDLYPFAEEPDQDPPNWTAAGDAFVRPPSYREQMRYDLRPGTFFIANTSLIDDVTDGKPAMRLPLVFPDGELARYELELKDTYTSEVRMIERRTVTGLAKIGNFFPEVSIYRSLYERDGSVRSVMQILAVEEGGFVSRGLASHDSNLPKHAGVFGLTVAPVSSTMRLDDIVPVNGTIDDSTLLISEAYFANTHQAGLFDDCDGLSICSDLCADTGLDQGDPGPACPPPPDPCEHVSPCGEGNGPGDPPATHQCNDGENNDGFGGTDASDPQCDHSPSCEPGGAIPDHVHKYEAGADFAMFGDVIWCTREGDNWPSRLLDRGYFTETPFHKNTGFGAYDDLFTWGDGAYSRYEKLVRLKVIGCWRLDTEEQAEDCANDLADCGAFAGGAHTYPYHFGRDAAGMWDGLKVDVWHARGIGMSDPLTVAHTVAGTLIGASEAENIPGFASVAGTNVNGQDASPHEIGHTLNLTHCEARLVDGLWTLEGNALQDDTCPDDVGNNQLAQFSNASGDKLFDCFTGGCGLPSPNFGDASP